MERAPAQQINKYQIAAKREEVGDERGEEWKVSGKKGNWS